MSLFGKLIPWWVQPLIIATLLMGLLGQRVQVSNAKANVARSAEALANYKLSVSETTRILQATNDRKAAENTARQLEAANAARTREAALRGAADDLRLERDRLLDAIRIASRRDPVPRATGAAKAEPANPIADVLGACTAEVQELAGASDAHASDLRTMIDAWPR